MGFKKNNPKLSPTVTDSIESTVEGIKVIEELSAQLKAASDAYYNGAAIMSDQEYDGLTDKLTGLEELHEYSSSYHPKRSVGADAKGQTIKHLQPVYSLSNVFNGLELTKFINDIDNKLNVCLLGTKGVILEYKLDGIACILRYDKHRLISAATRGNGVEGRDITECALHIRNIPTLLQEDMPDTLIEIYGEIFIPRADFAKMKKTKSTSNIRNTTAGLVNRRKYVPEMTKLYFAPHGYSDDVPNYYRNDKSPYPDVWDYDEIRDMMRDSFDVDVTNTQRLCSMDEVINYCREADKARSSDQFFADIDGVVIKVLSTDDRQTLGNTGHHPRWATAFKFMPAKSTTTLRDVHWDISAHGVYTPVAIFDEIYIGAAVKRASLYNYGYFKELGLRHNSIITVARQGDVIPKVINNLSGADHKAPLIEAPTHCYHCYSELKKWDVGNGRSLICPNGSDCPGTMASKVTYICSREILDIDDIGITIAEHLAHRGYLVNGPFFIFTPDFGRVLVEELKYSPEFAAKIVGNVRKASVMDYATFYSALQIPGFGKQLCGTVIRHCNMSGISPDKPVLDKIKGIGDVLRSSWEDYFNPESETYRRYQYALQSGIAVFNIAPNLPLSDSEFVITGKLSKHRGYYEQQLRDKGAKVNNRVSIRPTNQNYYLVTGLNPTPDKLYMANQVGYKIITEEDLNLILSS